MSRSLVIIGIVFLTNFSLVLYLRLKMYLFPAARGHIHAGAGFTGFGSLLVTIGILTSWQVLLQEKKKILVKGFKSLLFQNVKWRG